jgi:UDP-N-acetylmuramoyl-L-alanyl-D-glutamate--2,6-diaminopimelate ligase
MPPKLLVELVAGLDGATIAGDRQTPVIQIAFDSRDVTPGGMFVAIRGGYVDGHSFLPAARSYGATSVLVERDTPSDSLIGYRAVVRVDGTRAALAHVATRYFESPSAAMRVVGVTGTDGKTTTSHMIDAICRANGGTTGLVGTVAVRIGDREVLHESRQTTPESLEVQGYLAAMREQHVDVAVLEATSHGLAMHRVDGCDFDVGVVTNITHEHLDFHGTVEEYRRAKASLLERVADARARGKLGVAVLNADDEGVRSVLAYARGCEVHTYSRRESSEADLRAANIRAHGAGTQFELVTRDGATPVELHLPGVYNISNALAAAGACLALGLSVAEVADGLGALASVPGRMEIVDAGQPFTLIVDYAHTPESLATLLREIRPATTGSLLVLFGSAGERDVAKRGVQGRVAVELADYAVFTSEDPRFEDPQAIIEHIAAGAIEAGGRPGVHFDCIEDRASAIREVLGRACAGDSVVLAGKGHEHSMIYGAERRPWDDAGQARATLNAMGYRDAARTLHPEDSQP